MQSSLCSFSIGISWVTARIFKRVWGPGIDSKEWIPPAYVAWRGGTITLFLLGSWGEETPPPLPSRWFCITLCKGDFFLVSLFLHDAHNFSHRHNPRRSLLQRFCNRKFARIYLQEVICIVHYEIIVKHRRHISKIYMELRYRINCMVLIIIRV